MNISIIGRQFAITQAIYGYVTEQLQSLVSATPLKITSATVVFGREKNRFSTSLVLRCKYHTLKAEIEGFDEDVATELQSRAQNFIAKRNAEFEEKSKSLGIDDKLQEIEGLDQDMLLALADKGIKTVDDLGDLAADELIEILGSHTLSETEANKVIMAARAHLFTEEA